MNYNDAVKYINKIPRYGTQTGVIRARYLLDKLEHPEKKMKIIHVAGTNGKGSVCSYLSNIICANGYKVGLFTSPHLLKVNERIQINQRMISDELFLESFHVVFKIKQELSLEGLCEITFFDFLFAMAIYIFQKEEVEYVILETGLGGRYDATNAIDHPILSIITSISLDHTEILGDTIGKIAYEKAGIIKTKVPVIYLDQNAEASSIIQEIANQMETKYIKISSSQWEIMKNNGKHIDFLLHNRYYKCDVFQISSPAEYQVMNCSIALCAIKVIEELNLGTFDIHLIKEGVRDTFWEGRMEEIMSNVLIDGAHNPDGIQTCIQSLQTILGDKRCTLLFSVVKDKHYHEMIKIICTSSIFDSFILTQLDGTRKLDKLEILHEFNKYTNKPIHVFNTVKEGFEYGLETKDNRMLFCAGSLYLVGEIKQIVADRFNS